MENEQPDCPDFRATVKRDGTVRLVPWGPWLAIGGPAYTLVEARGRAGFAIADLTVIRDEQDCAAELIVEFRGGGEPAHTDAVTAWARQVGYRRIWFDGTVTDLEPDPGGQAETRCTGCRVHFIDGSHSFWEYARHTGAFPYVCQLCGCDLPQWTSPRKNESVRRPARAATHQ